ncbi:MAG: trimeric intracellular cation channel family protein [Bacteroidetes bacterium]|nr:MAG: trimeric intracellular cation channel family protein [Bacteroidota bacterium]
MNVTDIIDHLGTFAFAVSGIRMASARNFDWFGAYVIGLVTAIGGGTTRDILLNVTPFWMQEPSYLLVTGLALLATLLFNEKIYRLQKTLFLFDTIGLGLFVVVGIEKSFGAGFPVWVCILMGTITGSVGGVIRDVLINEIPLLFRRDIYALACVAGGLVFFGCQYLALSTAVTSILAALSVILVRLAAVKYHIQLPTLKSDISNK